MAETSLINKIFNLKQGQGIEFFIWLTAASVYLVP